MATGVLAYGALELLEGVGLWLMRRWGEYVAAVGTSVFIPLEVYELVERVTWVRVAAMVVNVAAVIYLLWTKRLSASAAARRRSRRSGEASPCSRSRRPQPDASSRHVPCWETAATTLHDALMSAPGLARPRSRAQ